MQARGIMLGGALHVVEAADEHMRPEIGRDVEDAPVRAAAE